MAERPRLLPLLAVSLVTSVGMLLAWALQSLPPQAPGLSVAVREHLPDSGVRAEVTAVLLNFRGYDTLLELTVMLAALLAAWHLGPLHPPPRQPPPGPVAEGLVRLLLPLTILVAGYVLWLGGHAAGGAFQAGALLAGAGVLLLLLRPGAFEPRDGPVLRLLLIAGPAVFALVAGGVMALGGSMLEYPRGLAGILILLIEAASTVSIAVLLLLLFAGGRPRARGGRR